jgi:UDP-galactopyranose mutase
LVQFVESTLLSEKEEMTLKYDLVCFSHLRWDFVYQRPQHLLSRCAQERRVFFIEEPIFEDGRAYLDISTRGLNLWIIVPHMPVDLSEEEYYALHARLLDGLFFQYGIETYVLWYYTPMAIGFTRHLKPVSIVYDCMDELSAFKGASPKMRHCERELLSITDLVFTGGYSLYLAKRHQHPHVSAFPSSVDTEHFRQAREAIEDPSDQKSIPHPRLGFYGVIDERMNLDLLKAIADSQPNWHLVLIGPVTKIDPEMLPQRNNIHYLGSKSYNDLPAYLAGWDVALLPFACNESTRFISPTKTPEYLAGGKPVVSTPIHDVVHPYAKQGLVAIGETASDFIAAIQTILSKHHPVDLHKVDAFLAQTSWDSTWRNMRRLIYEAVARRQGKLSCSMTSSSARKSDLLSARSWIGGD